jgi:hypothetical protein
MDIAGILCIRQVNFDREGVVERAVCDHVPPVRPGGQDGRRAGGGREGAAPQPPAPDKTWLYAMAGAIGFGLAVSLLVASTKPDASWPVTILGGLILILVLASPVVLVVCLLIMLVKYVAKQTMREMDAERKK